MKAWIWKDRETGAWRYALPGCCEPYDASGSRPTRKEALSAVQAHISAHRMLNDVLLRVAQTPAWPWA